MHPSEPGPTNLLREKLKAYQFIPILESHFGTDSVVGTDGLIKYVSSYLHLIKY
jgi:hypothetical protein